MTIPTLERYQGSHLGLAIHDAMGNPYESVEAWDEAMAIVMRKRTDL